MCRHTQTNVNVSSLKTTETNNRSGHYKRQSKTQTERKGHAPRKTERDLIHHTDTTPVTDHHPLT